MFREHLPQMTGKENQYKRYKKYKKILCKDFYSRCGYCNDSHYLMGGKKTMHIDHFVPKVPFSHLENTYSNLVYSCFYCNNAKSNDWVTDDANTSISPDGNSGYVNPRLPAYDDLFTRNGKGSIIPNNKLAFYIYTNLNLGLKRHELLYTIERLKKVVDDINQRLDKGGISNEVSQVLEKNRSELLLSAHKFENQFRAILDAR